MNILITGGTGLIGFQLTNYFLKFSHQVTILTRSQKKAFNLFGRKVNYWLTLKNQKNFNKIDIIINLAGEPIASKRWTLKQKKKICYSRWNITKELVNLINSSIYPPSVFISGSAIGFYGDQKNVFVTEKTKPKNAFTYKVCENWEKFALMVNNSKTRVCLLRTGIVLAKEGGVLNKILPFFRLCLGGYFGDGDQYFPWIHIEDVVKIIYYLSMKENLNGAYNIVAPSLITNKEFTVKLAKILNRPIFLKISKTILKILIGEMAILFLSGQRAVPERLKNLGFNFSFKKIEIALKNLIS